jgi:signal transduction histidine kinase
VAEHMRLAEFILSNVEAILTEWERFARSLTPGSEMNVIALRDHAEDILRGTARDMLSSQSVQEQSDKSKGRGSEGTESDRLDRASTEHALDRLGYGFNLIEVVAEYRALRATVLRLWRETVHQADDADLQDLTRFNEAVDQSLAEAVRSFTNRVDESRQLFLATLGHDLRTPLTAMVVSAELMMLSGQLDDDNAQVASQMVRSGRVMASMIHDLLDFTRTRLGAGMPVSRAPLDLATLCLEVLEEFRAAHPDRDVHFESAGTTSGEWDAARLRQVLSNLIANAIEHGDQDSSIDVSARGEDAEVLLIVANRGPVIPPDALPTLFDPLVQAGGEAGAARRAASTGIGLGLYIAREIVMAHGGTIAVASAEESGTVFTVRLPRKEPTRRGATMS